MKRDKFILYLCDAKCAKYENVRDEANDKIMSAFNGLAAENAGLTQKQTAIGARLVAKHHKQVGG